MKKEEGNIFLKFFSDIKNEIDILKSKIWDIENDIKQLECDLAMNHPKVVNGYAVNFDNGEEVINITNYIEKKEKLQNEKIRIERVINGKKEVVENIKKNLREMKGLDMQIAYLRDIEGLTLSEIAKILNFSTSWIKKKSSKIKRMNQ